MQDSRQAVAEAAPEQVAARQAREIAAQLDRAPLTRLHWLILAACALGLMFDVIEAALGNALAAVFSGPPYHVQSGELSLLLASVFIGGAVGAPLFGWLADRRGRRLMLTCGLLLLAGASVWAAASRDIADLTASRLLSGLAIGAYPPLMVAYLSDVLPPRRRGALIMLVGAFGFLGAPIVVILIRWLTPLQPLGLEGWRWALLIGAIGAAAIAVLFLLLPESPRWLAAAGRNQDAAAALARFRHAPDSIGGEPPDIRSSDASSTAQVSASSPRPAQADSRRRRIAALCALFFLSPWATVGFPLLSGAVLVEKGFQIGDSLLFLALSLLGPSIGSLASVAFVDRIDRRATLALCASGMIVFGLSFAIANTLTLLIVAGLIFNIVSSIYIGALSIYGGELFPTTSRATLSSSAWAINRVASALAPLALLPLLKSSGPLAMFAVITAALAASVAIILAFGQRGLSRRPVD